MRNFCGVDIFSGGVELLVGLRNFRGVEKLLRGIEKYSGGLRNVQGGLNFFGGMGGG